MARVKQFADDLGISKNQAQALINKGRSRKDGGSQILEKVMKKPIYAQNGKNVVLPKKRPDSIKKKKTSEQIVREKNELELTKADITTGFNKDFSESVAKANKKKDGGFPDLTGDGKVTQKDILKGRGVPGFSRGGGIAIQGLGFKGVRQLEEQGEDAPSSVDGTGPSVGGDDSVDTDIGSGFTSNRTNVSNVGPTSNLSYSPTFSAEVAMSQGLNPYDVVPGFTGLGLSPNSGYGINSPAAQRARNQQQISLTLQDLVDKGLYGTKDQQAVVDAFFSLPSIEQNQLAKETMDAIKGGFYGTTAQQQGIAGLRDDDLGFMAMSLGYAPPSIDAQGRATGNQFGPGSAKSSDYSMFGPAGAMLGLARGIGLVDKDARGTFTTTPADYYDTVAKGLDYTQRGGNIASFGNLGSITDKMSQDFSNIGKNISSAFSDAIGFMTDPRGGSNPKNSDFTGLMSTSVAPQSFDMFGGRTKNTSDSMSRDAAYGSLSSKANEKEGYGIASLDLDKSKDADMQVADALSIFSDIKGFAKDVTNKDKGYQVGPGKFNVDIDPRNPYSPEFKYNIPISNVLDRAFG